VIFSDSPSTAATASREPDPEEGTLVGLDPEEVVIRTAATGEGIPEVPDPEEVAIHTAATGEAATTAAAGEGTVAATAAGEGTTAAAGEGTIAATAAGEGTVAATSAGEGTAEPDHIRASEAASHIPVGLQAYLTYQAVVACRPRAEPSTLAAASLAAACHSLQGFLACQHPFSKLAAASLAAAYRSRPWRQRQQHQP